MLPPLHPTLARAAQETRQGDDMDDYAGFFITWTTYGTWLPGDARGWRKRIGGEQQPRPLLEAWCRE